ncbi:ABC transporter substrate-binding protein [Halovivax limisalsi]|uniref:ABC transporter substrate-binding protein n=1 Tax=Halovivax limisalsi TaxID=1453760 RepID=UPI001FFDE713|nr:ABC transporter substrate-binding protein [Halovivax limisalsi]
MSADETGIDRRQFLAVAGTGAATATLSGCLNLDEPSGDGDDGGDGGDGSGNELVYIDLDSLTTTDPARASGASDYSAIINIYDPLFYVEAETFRTIENLATDWEASDDGTQYEVTIRDDATHHNGDPVTAEDVAFSMNRLMSINESPASVFAGIFGENAAEAVDETTVSFDLQIAYAPVLTALTQLFVVNSNEVRDAGEDYLNDNTAGSGPYELDGLTEGSRLSLTAFEDYWGGWEDDQFDSARHEVISEESTARIMMEQGDADLTSKFLSADTYDELEGYDNVRVAVQPELFLWHITMNTQKPPFDDVKVREAVAHSFDYQAVVENVLRDGQPAAGPVPVGMPGHNDDLEPYGQDLDAAQAALEESSYTVEEINSYEMEHMYTNAVAWAEPITLILEDGLGELGISIQSNNTPWAQMLERASSQDTTPHFTQVGNTARIASPDWHTYGQYHPSVQGEINASAWYENDEVTTLLEDARTTFDEEERFSKYREAQSLVYEDYPSIFIANPAYKAGINENLGGWKYRGVLSYEHRWYEMFRDGDGRA